MDFFISLSATVVAFVGGWYLGYNYCYNKVINELTGMITDQLEILTHEIVEGKHYLYYTENNSFASQGDTLDEAAKNFSLNSVGSIGHVEKTPLNVPFFIIDGKIESDKV